MRTRVAVLTLAFAAPAAAHPCPGARPTKTLKKAAPAKVASPTAEHVMQLYMRTAATLRLAQRAAPTATEALFTRFRFIHIADALRSPDKRAAAVVTLEKLEDDAKKLAP